MREQWNLVTMAALKYLCVEYVDITFVSGKAAGTGTNMQLNYNFWLCVELFSNHGVNLLHMTIHAVCV